MPIAECGLSALHKRMSNEIKYPRHIDQTEPGSLITISFVVNSNGKITHKKVVRNDFTGMVIPNQMFKVIESTQWIVGTCQGKPVSVMLSFPLRICLFE